jgi:decaprenyl-phosphate phosphoribosyltransferase
MSAGGSSVIGLLRTLRPHQWVKNGFVVAPLVFARHLEDPAYLVRTGLAFAAFCALSGAVYAFNDVRDVEADRAHPTKRNRPIASGRLSERAALIASVVLAVAGLAVAFALDVRAGVCAAIYLGQNLAYSIRLKHVAFIDVTLIAIGFLLRVLAGAFAIDVPPSTWLLICTGLVALCFALGKRAHELAAAERSGRVVGETRAALAGYRLPIVRIAMLVLGAATAVAYVLYTRDAHTVAFFGTDRLVWSAPFPALGIARFLMLALWRPGPHSPTEAMLRDPWFLLILAAWAGVVVTILYG